MNLENTQWKDKGTSCNITICTKLNAQNFEEYFKTGQKERYYLICSVDAYYKYNVPMPSYESSGGGRPIRSAPSKKSQYSLSYTINFLDN